MDDFFPLTCFLFYLGVFNSICVFSKKKKIFARFFSAREVFGRGAWTNHSPWSIFYSIHVFSVLSILFSHHSIDVRTLSEITLKSFLISSMLITKIGLSNHPPTHHHHHHRNSLCCCCSLKCAKTTFRALPCI